MGKARRGSPPPLACCPLQTLAGGANLVNGCSSYERPLDQWGTLSQRTLASAPQVTEVTCREVLGRARGPAPAKRQGRRLVPAPDWAQDRGPARRRDWVPAEPANREREKAHAPEPYTEQMGSGPYGLAARAVLRRRAAGGTLSRSRCAGEPLPAGPSGTWCAHRHS